MRTVIVTVGTMCLTILLLALGQRLVFTVWSSSVWDSSAPVESTVFDEIVLYTIFPLIVIVGAVVATTLTRRRPFAVSMLGTLPVFLGVIILRRFETISMALYVIGYTLLCFAIVKLTDRLWVAKRRSQRDLRRKLIGRISLIDHQPVAAGEGARAAEAAVSGVALVLIVCHDHNTMMGWKPSRSSWIGGTSSG